MGLSTHVLDTMHGCPAAGMEVKLYATDGEQATLLKSLTLNHDGRTDAPLFDNHSLKTGTYRLSFNVAGYFKAKRRATSRTQFPEHRSPGFRRGPCRPALPRAAAGQPWSYSTYRGS